MVDVVSFGEVLWDVIDGVPHIGGAPFNFAAHIARCGLTSSLVSAVGDDELGCRAKGEISRLKVDDRFVGVHPTLPTGTVNVTLQNGIPSYEIVCPVAWDEITVREVVSLGTPRAFYFGSLAQRSSVSARTLCLLLDAFPMSLVFFDVNLRQEYWSRELIVEGVARANVLKVNDEEMAALRFDPVVLFRENPRLRVIVETCGADGCVVWSRDGKSFDSPAMPDGRVVDTVGAGDSFSAAFLAAMLRGESLVDAARKGNVLAGKVAARVGAVPDFGA